VNERRLRGASRAALAPTASASATSTARQSRRGNWTYGEPCDFNLALRARF